MTWPACLAHRVYVASLPRSSVLRTPLYFSSAEQALLRGTSVLGAAQTQAERWTNDWEAASLRWGVSQTDGFTWCVPERCESPLDWLNR